MTTHLSASIHFAAPPARVLAMLCDESYLAAKAADSVESSFDVKQDANQVLVTLVRVWPKELPEMAARLVGKTVTITEVQHWDVSNPDVARATFEITFGKAPVNIKGTMKLVATVDGTDILIDGEASVSVPIFGKTAESMISSELVHVMEREQVIGQTWLNS
jgi:hypothetical protein